MRFRQDARFGHLVFLLPKDFTELVDLLVHAVKQLAHGVDLHLAAFELLQREADSQVFGELHQDAFVQFFVLSNSASPASASRSVLCALEGIFDISSWNSTVAADGLSLVPMLP